MGGQQVNTAYMVTSQICLCSITEHQKKLRCKNMPDVIVAYLLEAFTAQNL